MLSNEEIHILSLLEELSMSSFPLQEQSLYVTRISELLQAQQEKHEAQELALNSSSSPSYFVKLCRHRLVEAQQQCLNNYRALRVAKTKRINEPSESTVESEGLKDSDITSEDALSRSIYESKSESITQILQRMHTTAQNEILQSEMNIEELDMSSKTMRDLQEKYSGVNVLLNGSRKLVKILDEAETKDRRLMLASLGFLAFVLLYIVYRRVLSGPVKILLWALFQLVGLAKKVPVGMPVGTHNSPSIPDLPPIVSQVPSRESLAQLSRDLHATSESLEPSTLEQLSEELHTDQPSELLQSSDLPLESTLHDEL